MSAFALVVVVLAVAKLRVLRAETGLDDVVGGASTSRLGHGRRRQDGSGEQEGLHLERKKDTDRAGTGEAEHETGALSRLMMLASWRIMGLMSRATEKQAGRL